jgi:hypothetical protein
LVWNLLAKVAYRKFDISKMLWKFCHVKNPNSRFQPTKHFSFFTPNPNLQEYLNCTVQLCAPGTAIPPGRHQFPLRVMIPSSAPSSFDSQFGTIRYSVRVILLTNSEQVGPLFWVLKEH